MSALGYGWLIDSFDIPPRPLAVSSRLGTRLRSREGPDGATINEYPPSYQPDNSVPGHLEFALKHEALDFCTLRDIFRASGRAPVRLAVKARPTSRYSRLMAFYYN